jgi:hypothetical protein
MTLTALSMPLTEQLERNGIVVITDLLTTDQLCQMQRAFNSRLKRMRWNDVDGYEMGDRYRHTVKDVLTLDQGFVDAALDPRVTDLVREYVGANAQLCEAKGWKSLPTHHDFHGWHGDMWYDQTKVDYVPREVKLGLYLTEVKSGAFKYIKGTHGKDHPRELRRGEADQFDPKDVVEVLGPAGAAFLFDTSGIHRQSVPVLEERHAVFFNYHDPSVPLQAEDVEYCRYSPLLLNAALLGELSAEDQRMLGFGNNTNYNPCFVRQSEHTGFHRLVNWSFHTKVVVREFRQRVLGKLMRVLGIRR